MKRGDPRMVSKLDPKIYTAHETPCIKQLARLGQARVRDMQVVASVLPFRVDNYVIEQLLDWSAAPDDAIFRLVFPSREMLDGASFARMAYLHDGAIGDAQQAAAAIRARLNLHPADQLNLHRRSSAGFRTRSDATRPVDAHWAGQN